MKNISEMYSAIDGVTILDKDGSDITSSAKIEVESSPKPYWLFMQGKVKMLYL